MSKVLKEHRDIRAFFRKHHPLRRRRNSKQGLSGTAARTYDALRTNLASASGMASEATTPPLSLPTNEP